MKIGFSTLACPGWDLGEVVEKAKEFGFDGVELRGLRGELNLPLVPALSRNPSGVKQMFADAKVECVSLGTSATLTSRKPRELANQKAQIIEFMELASAIGCPFVRCFMGDIESSDTQRIGVSRIATAVASLVPIASRLGVTLLLENNGDFASSRDLWFVVDAVSHPNVKACWNQCLGITTGERATQSIPRLGTKIGMLRICDASFDEDGVLMQYCLPGHGGAEVAKQVELVRGLLYEGYLMFEWPKLWVASLPGADAALPEVARFLRACVDQKQAILSAYKGDKKVPSFAGRGAAE